MVDVGQKPETERTATAEGRVHVGAKIHNLIAENQIKKGDVLSVAQIAGIMGAKKTSELIPLCHSLNLNHAQVSLQLEGGESVLIRCSVRCQGKTGVEMEALTGVSIAALTLYDMCKAVSHDITIRQIRLLSKTGGKSGVYDISENN